MFEDLLCTWLAIPLSPKQPTNQPTKPTIFQGIRHDPFEKNVEEGG